MKYRHFQIPPYGGEAEEELNRFLGQVRVTAVEQHFVADGNDSYWAFCVRFVQGPEASTSIHVVCRLMTSPPRSRVPGTAGPQPR